MEGFCSFDPGALCENFRTPSTEAVARFERNLEVLLKARELARVIPQVRQYLRQYWAYSREGRVVIHGNFVCPSIVNVDMDNLDGSERPDELPVKHPSAPIVVDDAGDCNVSVWFFADEPESMEGQLLEGEPRPSAGASKRSLSR